MPASYPTQLRVAAVEQYESGEDTGAAIAERFGISVRTLRNWAKRARESGSLEPSARGGGNFSTVQPKELLALLAEKPDANVDELTRRYNRGRSKRLRVHRSTILRALKREGMVFKKNAPAPWSSCDPKLRRNAKTSNDGC